MEYNLFIIAMVIACSFASYHLFRLLFVLWFVFHKKDRHVITNKVMDMLVANVIKINDPDKLLMFISLLLKNQDYGQEVTKRMARTVLEVERKLNGNDKKPNKYTNKAFERKKDDD